MTQVNIAQARARFSELVRKAISGEEVVIAGARGKIWMAPDFGETPSDFKEYF